MAVVDIPFGGLEDGLDPGVTVEANLTYGQICGNLGLDTSGRHQLLNDVLHTGLIRLNEWTDADIFEEFRKKGQKHPEARNFVELRLHFHQIQALHSVIRQFFTKKRDMSNGLGVVITDVPGLGKSLEALSVVTFLISVGMRQDAKMPLPPLIGESHRYCRPAPC